MKTISFKSVSLFVLALLGLGIGRAQSPGDSVVVTTVWRHNVNGTDRTSVTDAGERNALSSSLEGSVIYLAKTNISGTVPFYRLFDGSTNHMDSTIAGEAGYATEGILGYAWQSAGLGMTAVQRAVR